MVRRGSHPSGSGFPCQTIDASTPPSAAFWFPPTETAAADMPRSRASASRRRASNSRNSTSPSDATISFETSNGPIYLTRKIDYRKDMLSHRMHMAVTRLYRKFRGHQHMIQPGMADDLAFG